MFLKLSISLPLSGGTLMQTQKELLRIVVIRWREDVEAPYGFGIITNGPRTGHEVYIKHALGRGMVCKGGTVSLEQMGMNPPRMLRLGDTILGYVRRAMQRSGRKRDWVIAWGLDESAEPPGTEARVLVIRRERDCVFGAVLNKHGKPGEEVFIPPANGRVPKLGWILAGRLIPGKPRLQLIQWTFTSETSEIPEEQEDRLQVLRTLGDPRKFRIEVVAGIR